jgi:ABC-type sugar transport system substrate-binding protein
MHTMSRLVMGFLIAMVVAVGISACGSDDKSSSPATAKESSSTSKAAPPSATIGWVDATLAGAYQQRIYDQGKAAVEHLGWKLKTVDTKGDPAAAASGVSSLVAQGVDGIIMSGITPSTARAGLLQAKQKNIPVMLVGSEVESNLNASLNLNYYGESEDELTKPLADLIIRDLKPGDKVGMLTTSFLLSGKQRSDTLTKLFEAAGIKVAGALETDFSFTGGVKNASTLLTQHKDLAALIPVYDLWTSASVSAVKSAGREKDVQVFSYYADSVNNPLMRKNPTIVKGLADGNMSVSSLIAVDQMLQVLAKKKAPDPKAADGKFKYVALEQDTLPPGDQSGPISADEAAAPYYEKWANEFTLPGS